MTNKQIPQAIAIWSEVHFPDAEHRINNAYPVNTKAEVIDLIVRLGGMPNCIFFLNNIMHEEMNPFIEGRDWTRRTGIGNTITSEEAEAEMPGFILEYFPQ